MGGFFGAISKNDCVTDVFFGTDYHSHLGTRRGGMTAYSENKGFQRALHSIENSPFRTKFEKDMDSMEGKLCIGCISDSDPQPILVRSKLGVYAISAIGIINNANELSDELLKSGNANFETMSSGKINTSSLVGALIAQKSDFTEGIKYAQEKIEGTLSLLILTENSIIAARDKAGRLPIVIGCNENGYCASLESFAFQKLGYKTYKELKPGEIVELTADTCRVLAEGNGKLKICTFLWTYYGYPNAVYEGVTVETMRARNGQIMAEHDIKNGTLPDVDYVCGVPDSGVPHAIGYANRSGIPYARPFIKYTPTWPRSFTPTSQGQRSMIAKMKLIPVQPLIKDKKLLLVDDSIVRGTQLGETTECLYESGAKEVHVRPACPPIMYGCKYLNFSRSSSEMELITRRVILEREGEITDALLEEYSNPDSDKYKAMVQDICDKLGFTSLQFARLDDIIEAIGLNPCKLCTYCWNGKE